MMEMMPTPLHKERQYFYFMEFEILWCTNKNKYISAAIKKELMDVFNDIKEKKTDYKIKSIAVYDDYVRIRIETTPKYNMTNILRSIKGVPAKHILRKFPELREQFENGLWDSSSVILTPNKDLERQITNFLDERRIRSCTK